MNKLVQLLRCLAHPRELRLALSGLGVRLSGDNRFGGLSTVETEGLVKWVRDFLADGNSAAEFIEVGTLFGFTARAVAATGIRTIALDNFSWNPFGLTACEHEAFARRVLSSSPVELISADASEYLQAMSDGLAVRRFVFLDGDHRYAAVKREIELARDKATVIAGHDYGNGLFGVTRAVDECFGSPDAVVGSCWIKRLKG